VRVSITATGEQEMLNELLSVKEVIKNIHLDWEKGGLLEVESHISAVLLASLSKCVYGINVRRWRRRGMVLYSE